jgi:predicted  nucleic acid-binding Zn-ribbon protein
MDSKENNNENKEDLKLILNEIIKINHRIDNLENNHFHHLQHDFKELRKNMEKDFSIFNDKIVDIKSDINNIYNKMDNQSNEINSKFDGINNKFDGINNKFTNQTNEINTKFTNQTNEINNLKTEVHGVKSQLYVIIPFIAALLALILGLYFK